MRPLTILLTTAGIGLVALALAPMAIPELRRYARPAAKQVLKTVLEASLSARVYAAELIEDVEDLVAEAQVEILRERMAGNTKPGAKPQQPGSRSRSNASRKRVVSSAA